MVRGKQKLTDAQAAQLEFISEAKAAHDTAKANIRIEARRWVEKRMEEITHGLEQAIYEGIQTGIPKRQIYQDGLGTSSPSYVTEVERRWDESRELTAVAMPHKPGPRYSVGRLVMHEPRLYAAWILDAENPDVRTKGSVPEKGRQEDDGYYVFMDAMGSEMSDSEGAVAFAKTQWTKREEK